MSFYGVMFMYFTGYFYGITSSDKHKDETIAEYLVHISICLIAALIWPLTILAVIIVQVVGKPVATPKGE